MKMKIDMDIAVRYLTGSAGVTEKNSFEAWLMESKEHRRQYEELRKYWEVAGKVYSSDEPDLRIAWNRIYQDTLGKGKFRDRGNHRVRSLIRTAVAASVLIAAGISTKILMDYGYIGKGKLIAYTTGDSLREIILSDSTVIWMNAHSRLEAPAKFHGRKRKVYLKGEAFFKVKRNPERPFQITAKNTLTRVLGTSFDIRAFDGDETTTVFVATGKVAFSPLDDETHRILLTPGMKGYYKTGSAGPLSLSNTNSNYLAWKTGELNFHNMPLEEVCQTLSEYYKVTIKADPEKAKNYLFTGSFQDLPLDQVLHIIAATLDIKFEKHDTQFSIIF